LDRRRITLSFVGEWDRLKVAWNPMLNFPSSSVLSGGSCFGIYERIPIFVEPQSLEILHVGGCKLGDALADESQCGADIKNATPGKWCLCGPPPHVRM